MRINPNRRQRGQAPTVTYSMQTAQCFADGCTRPEAGYGYCTDHGYEAEETTPAEPRTGWREDGRVDIDAVRAGAHDVNDSPAVFESLCDEVEELRAVVAKAKVQMQRVGSYSAPVPTVIAFDALGAVRDILGGVR